MARYKDERYDVFRKEWGGLVLKLVRRVGLCSRKGWPHQSRREHLINVKHVNRTYGNIQNMYIKI